MKYKDFKNAIRRLKRFYTNDIKMQFPLERDSNYRKEMLVNVKNLETKMKDNDNKIWDYVNNDSKFKDVKQLYNNLISK